MNASKTASKTASMKLMSCHAVDKNRRTLMTIDASALVEEKNSFFNGHRNKFFFALDFSLSMKPSISYLVAAMKELVDEIALGSMFSIISFHSTASVIFSTNEFTMDERAKCNEALSRAAECLGSSTNIEAGLNLVAKIIQEFHYERDEVHMLVLTDGEANSGQCCYAALAALADSAASTVHSCMFGRQSAVGLSARLNEINPVHSGYYIENGDALKTAFVSILSSMKSDSIYATMGEVTKTIPPAAATGTLHLIFDVDPKSDPTVELKIGEGDPKFNGPLDGFLTNGMDECVLEMHVRIADAYNKVSAAITAVKKASAAGDNAQVSTILELFDDISVTTKAIENDFESISVKDEPVYRSLSDVCDNIRSLKNGFQPSVVVHDINETVAPMQCDDDDGTPQYRGLSATVSVTSRTSGGSMAHKIQSLPSFVF